MRRMDGDDRAKIEQDANVIQVRGGIKHEPSSRSRLGWWQPDNHRGYMSRRKKNGGNHHDFG